MQMSLGMLRVLFLNFFIIVTVLYYFFRFQFEADSVILFFNALLIVLIMFYVVIELLMTFLGQWKAYDLFLLLVLFYSLGLLFLSVIQGGKVALLYALKDYVFPVAFGIFVSRTYKVVDVNGIGLIISIVCSIVGLIYLFELVSVLSGNGFFSYTNSLQELYLEVHGEKSNMVTYMASHDGVPRLPGPLGHTNSTGLILAIGVISSILVLNNYSKIAGFSLLLICLSALFVSASRTGFFSMLIGVSFYFISIGRLRSFLKYALFLFMGLLLILVSNDFLYDGVSSFYSLERMLRTFLVMIYQFEELANLKGVYHLFSGAGFNYPGMQATLYSPVLNDELFIIQMISIYGLLPICSFFIVLVLLNRKYMPLMASATNDSSRIFMSIIVCMLVSTIHTNAMVKPQIYPILFLSLGVLSISYKKIHHLPMNRV